MITKHSNIWKTAIALGLAVFFLVACVKEEPKTPNPSTSNLLVIPEGFPEMTFPEGNDFTKARWELGKKLFYDPILSVDNTISCASCHKANLAFADDKAFSPGVENRPGVRNAPSLGNVGYHPYLLREGSVPTLEMQVLVPIQEHNEFAHDMLAIVKILEKDPEYIRMSREAYDREPDPFVITRSISNFQRTLISGNSPYDKFHFQGKTNALSESQKRGMDLFFGNANCSSCHSGFNFTDYSFQNNGLDSVYADRGRARLTGLPEDEAVFKVPSLRNAEVTAPYMHDGRFATLMEVVKHYSTGGAPHPNKNPTLKPLNLSTTEKEDLVAFLNSLTDRDFIENVNFRE